MTKQIVLSVCVVLLALTYGSDHSVEMIQEDTSATMMADIVYRLSWTTQYDPDPAKTASKGSYKIEIKGKANDGASETTTGAKTFVTHPGYSCGAASDPECYPGVDGKVIADDDSTCACDPSVSGYDEEDAKWSPRPGVTQHFFLEAANVGEITEVIVTGDSAVADGWTPASLKINMNSRETGLGNGVYYMDIGKQIDTDNSLTLKSGATDSDGQKISMENMPSHKYGIIKCEAAACEEAVEKKMAAEKAAWAKKN